MRGPLTQDELGKLVDMPELDMNFIDIDVGVKRVRK